MQGRSIVVGAAIAAAVALGPTGVARAQWDDDWHDHGPGQRPGCDWDDHGMGPGMMDPYPACDWPDHGMGTHPDDGWWDD